MRAVVYLRISRDRGGESLGVQRQESECRELCDRSGWIVSDVLVDNDISAYSGKRRPAYESLLTMIKSGQVDVVVAWNTDRLHRRLGELVEYTEVCGPRRVTTHTVRTGPIDLSTPSGILVAQQLGAVAEYESRNRSARVKSAKQQRAERGSWSGGSRPFGWSGDGVTEIPAEVEMIRAASHDVLQGASLTSIARKWRATGSLTVTGKQWTASAVRDVLLRARNAGLRQHRGVVVGPATWEPIVSPETWHAVRRLLTDPDRVTSPGSQPKHLGSLRYRCGATLPDGSECGAPLRIARGGKPPTRKYICSRVDKQDVFHVTVNRAAIDEYVTDRLVRGMHEQGFGPTEDAPQDVPVDNLAEIEAAQTALANELAAGRLSAGAFSAANAQLASRMVDAQAQVADSTVRRATDVRLSGFDRDPFSVWETLPLDVKRDLLDSFLTVTVLPAVNRSRYTEPVRERVRLDWNFTLE